MKKKSLEWKANVKLFMDSYKDDMINYYLCDANIDHWETVWLNSNQDQDQLPSTVETTISSMSITLFPNIHRVLTLLGVVPVTTCSCEQSISVQRRLKTYLRSTMLQDRYSNLVLMNIHYGMDIDNKEILDRLIIKHPKRLEMKNVLADEDKED